MRRHPFPIRFFDGHDFFRTNGPWKDWMPLDLTVRVTDIYRKVNGKWPVIHEHVSWPVDLATGKAASAQSRSSMDAEVAPMPHTLF
jgi:hypothetical protein